MKKNSEYCKRYRQKKKLEKNLLAVPFAMRGLLKLRKKWTQKEYETKAELIKNFNSFSYSFDCLDLQTADAFFASFQNQDLFLSSFFGILQRGLQCELIPTYAKIFCNRLLSPADVRDIFARLLIISGRAGNFILIKNEMKKIIEMLGD